MPQPEEQAVGLSAALGAFLFWGFLPLYFNAFGPQVSAWEILVHRVIWAAVLLGAFTLATRRSARLHAIFTNPRMLLPLAASAALISVNWGTFIWAVTHHHVLEASLGYYVNPLLNVLLGFLFLRERLRPLQLLAVAIATLGVLIMVAGYGQVPWVALVLAIAFGLYGLIRKQVTVDGATGLLVETLLLMPVALAWLGWMYASGDAAFLVTSGRIDALLVGAGVMTIVPLVLFAVAARRLRLGTVGLIQYITPTLQLVTGVLLLGESFTRTDAVTFAFIWIGLAVYSTDALLAQRRLHREHNGRLSS